MASQVPVEAVGVTAFEVAGTDPGQGERGESQLVKRFVTFMENRGHAMTRWRIRPPGETSTLYTDPYWEEGNELFEAKPSCDRQAVRMAVAQLLDYRRHIPSNPRLTVLLPCRPSKDVEDFAERCGIGFLLEREDGGFERMKAIT